MSNEGLSEAETEALVAAGMLPLLGDPDWADSIETVERILAARTSAAATRAADDVLKVIGEYFDLDADPWEDHDAACPAPEDLWRLHRDLKAAIARTTP